MPTDRAQDTEAIRAAPRWDGASHDPISTEQAHEVAANWRDTTQLANALDAMADEADRLVARLGAAERALALNRGSCTYCDAGIERVAAPREARDCYGRPDAEHHPEAINGSLDRIREIAPGLATRHQYRMHCGLSDAQAAARDALAAAAPGETEQTP